MNHSMTIISLIMHRTKHTTKVITNNSLCDIQQIECFLEKKTSRGRINLQSYIYVYIDSSLIRNRFEEMRH